MHFNTDYHWTYYFQHILHYPFPFTIWIEFMREKAFQHSWSFLRAPFKPFARFILLHPPYQARHFPTHYSARHFLQYEFRYEFTIFYNYILPHIAYFRNECLFQISVMIYLHTCSHFLHTIKKYFFYILLQTRFQTQEYNLQVKGTTGKRHYIYFSFYLGFLFYFLFGFTFLVFVRILLLILLLLQLVYTLLRRIPGTYRLLSRLIIHHSIWRL